MEGRCVVAEGLGNGEGASRLETWRERGKRGGSGQVWKGEEVWVMAGLMVGVVGVAEVVVAYTANALCPFWDQACCRGCVSSGLASGTVLMVCMGEWCGGVRVRLGCLDVGNGLLEV